MKDKFFKFQAYVNGEFLKQDKYIKIYSPLTLKPCGKVPALSSININEAFRAARSAFKHWKDNALWKRENYLKDFADKLKETSEELAEIIHIECGKSFASAISEIKRSIAYIYETIAAWPKIQLKTDSVANKESIQHRVPLGIVLAISSYNYPVNLAVSKIIPALLVGNTVVYKSATNASLVGGFLAKLWNEIKLPPGVFNFVTGAGKDIGDTLTSHEEINMISFTGSVKVGRRIAKANPLIPKVLELGGNDCAYVRADADLDNAVNEVSAGAFSFSGQRCTAIKRLIVDKKIEEKFINKLKAKISTLEMVPIINKENADHINFLYKDALCSNEAKVIIEPKFNINKITVGLVRSSSKAHLWHEEQFGPILPYVVSNNDQEAIEMINKTNFGLQNSIFTTNIEWAKANAKKIESGTVNINGKPERSPDSFPFLGIKNSGLGVQGINESLLSMTRVLNLVINK